jgi:hypothetical protein
MEVEWGLHRMREGTSRKGDGRRKDNGGINTIKVNFIHV